MSGVDGIPQVTVVVTGWERSTLVGYSGDVKCYLAKWTTSMLGDVFIAQTGKGTYVAIMWDTTDERNEDEVDLKVGGLLLTTAQRDMLNLQGGREIVERLAKLSRST